MPGVTYVLGQVPTPAEVSAWLTSVANADVATNANIVGSKLASNARRLFAKADVQINLAASAVANLIILHPIVAATARKLTFLYTEASDANTGINISVGNETNANYYYVGLSEVNCNGWYEKDATLLNSAIAAGNTMVCGCEGGKVGTGKVLVCAEFDVND